MDSPLAAISPLVERFPALSAQERATLLDWTRQTPLVYGAWKPFKLLYKKVEAPLLANAAPANVSTENAAIDIELLGALLARLDAAAITPAAARLKAVENGNVSRGKSVAVEGGSFSVGGRTQYDWSGFRLKANYEASSSGLLGRLEAMRQLFGLKPSESAKESKSATWDFASHDYIGGIKKVSLVDGVLRLDTEYQNKNYAIDVSDPTFPHLQDQTPLPATWQYIKRRVRRLLRTLSKSNADVYWRLLLATWHQSTLKNESLDFAVQWANVDTLFGGGERWMQPRAGRGPYVRSDKPQFNRQRREERAPAIWDAHLDGMPTLFADEAVPLEVCATALKVLWAHHRPIPQISAAQTLRFLNGPVPILKALATRALAEAWERGESVSGATAGAAYLMAGGPVRRRLSVLVEAQLNGDDKTWRDQFVVQLLRIIDEAVTAGTPQTRRARTSATLLAERLNDRINDDALFRHLDIWLNVGDAGWVFERLRRVGARGKTERLAALLALPAELRQRAIEAFVMDAGGAKPSTNAAFDLVTTGDVELNRIGWQYLGATIMEASNIRALYKRLLERWFQDGVYGPAFSEAGATRLFERAAWSAKDVEPWTQGYYYYTPWRKMLSYASADFFLVALRFLPAENAPREALMALSSLREEVAREVVPRLADLARDFKPALADLQTQTWTLPVWQFVAGSAVESATLLELWPGLWQRAIDSASAPFAIALLKRAEVPDETIAEWLPTTAAIKAEFAPDFFVYLLRRVPGASKVLWVLDASPEQWRAARPILLEMLRDSGLRGAIWSGVWSQLRGENPEAVLARLDSDAEIRASFNQIDKVAAEEFFGTTEIAHEPFLMSWLDAHQSDLERDDVALIAAATCPLPDVRDRGLERVRQLGLDLPLALRLMESNLPPSAALGRTFFEQAAERDQSDFALALCDSPQVSVRAYGREFIQAHQSTLMGGDLLEKLSENSDATMQAWVGEQLLSVPDDVRAQANTVDFDRAVLRGRGRARRAKEAVKTRIAQSPTESEVDVQALLETARGTTSSDREWALQQLAALALSGRSIPGISIKSVE